MRATNRVRTEMSIIHIANTMTRLHKQSERECPQCHKKAMFTTAQKTVVCPACGAKIPAKGKSS